MKQLFFLLIAVVSAPAVAATNTVLGTTEAMRCYQESQLVLNMQGVRSCDKAIEEGNLTRRDLAATYSNRGLIYAGNGELERALKDHNKAIEILPTLGQAYINRGNVYHHMRRYEEALADYKKAIALETAPRHIPWYNTGLTLLKMKRYDEALAAFHKALEYAPDSKTIKDKVEFIENMDEKDKE
jgi:tetratricopeptide (TPR) repeat protein